MHVPCIIGVEGVDLGMPLFEYACRACGHRFETLVTGSRQPVCMQCASPDLEKLFSTFSTRGGGDGPANAATSRFT